MTLLPMPLSKRSIRIYLERRLMPVFMDFGKHVSKLDRHEICRYLELFYALKYRKLKLQASSSNQSQMPSSSVKAEAYQTAPSNQFTAQYVADGLKGIDKLVVDYLQQPGSLAREAGVHQEELAKQLGIPLDKILVSLNGLVDEGLVYSSIDDCHFRLKPDVRADLESSDIAITNADRSTKD